MKKIVTLVIITLAFSTCGIEEFFYLPQATVVTTGLDSDAEIYLPSLSQYYYAEGYIIFYRIYLTKNTGFFSSTDLIGTTSNSSTNRSNINPALNSNYNTLHPYTELANYSSQITDFTFSNLNYYELFYADSVNDYRNINNKLTSSGGTLYIRFYSTIPGQQPEFSINSETYHLARAIKSGTTVVPDRYFFWTTDITRIDNNTNVDISDSPQAETAYISMYIIAVGSDNMKSVYGKPTHIGIFKLPNKN